MAKENKTFTTKETEIDLAEMQKEAVEQLAEMLEDGTIVEEQKGLIPWFKRQAKVTKALIVTALAGVGALAVKAIIDFCAEEDIIDADDITED